MGQAAGLLLRELGDFEVDLYLGDADAEKAREAAEWICHDSTRTGAVEPFHLPAEGTDAEFDSAPCAAPTSCSTACPARRRPAWRGSPARTASTTPT